MFLQNSKLLWNADKKFGPLLQECAEKQKELLTRCILQTLLDAKSTVSHAALQTDGSRASTVQSHLLQHYMRYMQVSVSSCSEKKNSLSSSQS